MRRTTSTRSNSSPTDAASSLSNPQTSAFTIHKIPPDALLERLHREYTKLCTIDADPRVNFATSIQLCYLNRYSNILANEHSLFPPSRDPALYINANQMPFETPHTMVASQAPISEEGLIPWWNVIWRYRVSLVMMLTREIENHIPKADRYWPTQVHEAEHHGPFRVVLESEEYIPELQLRIRQLSVSKTRDGSLHDPTSRGSMASSSASDCTPPVPSAASSSQIPSGPEDGSVHNVTQVHYLGWPDHGIPASTAAFRKMIERVEQHPTDAPIFVHCSAGIGRTGTLIGYYAVKQMLLQGRLTDRTVFETVGAMKHARRGMVQRFDQYHFIYQCLLEEISGRTPQPIGTPTP